MRTAEKLIAVTPRILALVTLLILGLLLSTPGNGAQDNQKNVDPDPLRPADTSSPRDTLHSFLSNTENFIGDFRQATISDRTYRAFLRAIQTLDFSTTSEGDTWFVRTQRVALLHELLARIELPPADDIPGDSEVADGVITAWTIPNTGITIAKTLQGSRGGQFLFSADTIQQLDGLYRQARHLPYRADATVGIYEDMTRLDTGAQGQVRELRNRLKSADTSSPRSTLEGFLDNVNRAYELVMEANAGLQARPPTISQEEARNIEETALRFLQRASDTLDLSQVPKALREDAKVETVLQLKEVFDRMLLPPIDTVPNAQTIQETRKDGPGVTPNTARAFRWKLPINQFEIVEILEGDRQGQFLFSTITVKQVSDVYKKIKDLPYRQHQFGGVELEYLSPGISPGFYESYASTSGYLIPEAHFMGRLVESLPDGFRALYGGQMVWQWASLILCLLLTLVIAYSIFHYARILARPIKPPSRDWLNLLSSVAVLLTVIIAGKFIDDELNFTGDLQTITKTAIASIAFVLTAWVVFVLFKAVAETIIATPKMRDQSSEAALLRVGARVIGFLVAVWIVIDGIRTLGADLIPLLAGLGIGGLAVALAAQSTIANFIGGLILLGNKPVRVGDFCRYGEDPSSDWLRIGTVEEINWISTRIRGLDRTVTTIPNAEFSNLHIINFSKRDQRLLRTTLQLRYETTAEQLRYILIKIRELILGHPMVIPDPARVRFLGYAAYSKDIEIFCYLRCLEHDEFLAIQEDIMLRIEGIINDAGSGFAFPSQTTYFSRDGGLNKERRTEAEEEIEQRRLSGKLPFPAFDEEERERLEDILDYPPRGSPGYKPRS